ncbi:MAG: hypothetical protein OCD02_17275 [Spirochaetaceae bacterium]
MNELQNILRKKYEAETDLIINKDDTNWVKYCNWLKKIKITEMNKEIFIENIFLKRKMNKALEIIYDGLSSRPNEFI